MPQGYGLKAMLKLIAGKKADPKVMTVGTIIASLLPVLWSTSTGSEVMRPIAIPIIGGMASSLMHILILTPVLYLLSVKRLQKYPA